MNNIFEIVEMRMGKIFFNQCDLSLNFNDKEIYKDLKSLTSDIDIYLDFTKNVKYNNNDNTIIEVINQLIDYVESQYLIEREVLCKIERSTKRAHFYTIIWAKICFNKLNEKIMRENFGEKKLKVFNSLQLRLSGGGN